MPSPSKTPEAAPKPKARARSKSSSRSSAPRSRSRSRSRTSNTTSSTSPTTPTRRRVSRSEPNTPAPKERKTPVRQSSRLIEKQTKQETETLSSNGLHLAHGDTIVKKSIVKQEITHAPGFGGSLGGAILTVLLPFTVFYITLLTDKKSGWNVWKLPYCPGSLSSFIDKRSFGLVAGWYIFQAILAVLPVGKIVKGQPIKSTGKRLVYRCNGVIAWFVSVTIFSIALYMKAPVEYVAKNWLSIVTAGVVFSFIISIWMYIKARSAKQEDLAPESTGSFFNDFFMGRELNPRGYGLDYKFFCELRPGLIGWMLVDWCLLASCYQKTGSYPPAFTMVVLFQSLYVFDALKNEAAILTTMDIITEGFGFMLAFGDLAWVPSLYCLQAIYIYHNPSRAVSNPYALAAIALLKITGYIIFRGSNSQKDLFRSDPNNPQFSDAHTIPTGTGKKLLASGFYGICRRPNYLGDLLMATSWSLLCGMSNPLPYFYPVYFAILLIHRCIRDEVYCKQKYGSSWNEYTKLVPYRILPYVF